MNTAMDVEIILFYKFTDIRNPEDFAGAHLDFCKSLDLLGKVLIAKEGINGSFSGSKEQIERYKAYLTGLEHFSNITFKEEKSTFSPFKKLVVRVKNEIIRMDRELDLTKTGEYISPGELMELYESGEDFIMLDTRNNYESQVGRFKNAVTPDIDTFREFPEAIKSLEDKKNSKIVTYCTGGIRCEKATAYMIEHGFTHVYQLKDGIINFCQKYPDTIWEGKCFVFDQRLISDVDPKSGTISKCVWCGESSDRYSNCKNPGCDDLVIMCEGCARKESGCCSGACVNEYKRLIMIKSRERQGYKFKGTA